MASNMIAKSRPWVIGVALAVGLLWLLRNTWPLQVLFLYFGLFTGIDIQNLWDPPVRWHTKQTLTIETPNGDVTSSVVRENVLQKSRLFDTALIYEKGEALVIEVSSGRYLFAIIEEGKPGETELFFPEMRLQLSASQLRTVKGKPIEIPPDRYPLFVTFGALRDPLSAHEVDPQNLPASFGPGYRVKSYTVEISDEPLTAGKIEQLLPWEATLEGSIGKDLKVDWDNVLRQLNDGSFKIG